MWYGQTSRHRQDACGTSFTSERSTLYIIFNGELIEGQN
jgi:hypothetical protein